MANAVDFNNFDIIVPTDDADEVENVYKLVEFFTLGRTVTNDEVLDEYKRRGLVPDVLAVIAYLKENPKFLDKKKYIGIQLNEDNHVTFYHGDGVRGVLVGRGDVVWNDSWLFGGVRKSLDTRTLDPFDIGLLKRIKALEEWRTKIEKIINV